MDAPTMFAGLPLTMAERVEGRPRDRVIAGMATIIGHRIRIFGRCSNDDLIRDGFRPSEVVLWAAEAREQYQRSAP